MFSFARDALTCQLFGDLTWRGETEKKKESRKFPCSLNRGLFDFSAYWMLAIAIFATGHCASASRIPNRLEAQSLLKQLAGTFRQHDPRAFSSRLGFNGGLVRLCVALRASLILVTCKSSSRWPGPRSVPNR